MLLTWADVDLDTKLEPVLETWPELERVLVDLSPSFRALENPLLRRTFSRAATLRQVAQAAGVPAEALLHAMARAIRVDESTVEAPRPTLGGARPSWTLRLPYARHDARFDVERGVHPLPGVLAELEALPDGEIYELLTPLVPAPLLGLAAKKGYEAHSELDQGRGFARTLIRRLAS